MSQKFSLFVILLSFTLQKLILFFKKQEIYELFFLGFFKSGLLVFRNCESFR